MFSPLMPAAGALAEDKYTHTHLHDLQLFQSLLDELLYYPRVALVLMLMKGILCSPSGIHSEVVVCKLGRLS
jgi:hypothetical protein